MFSHILKILIAITNQIIKHNKEALSLNRQKKKRAKSETPKSSVKSEYKSSNAYSHSGMAQPVLPLSKSVIAISHGTVKSGSSSSS